MYGKVRRSAVLGIALGLMRGKEPRHGRRERLRSHAK
jgi:hypothetical protein